MRLRSASTGPLLFRRMLKDADPKARAGDVVAVYDKSDAPYGVGLYNPKSLVSLRMLSRGTTEVSIEELFARRLGEAVALRRGALALDAATDAYRLVHAEGDGLSGLVVDKYGDVCVAEYYSLGMFKQADLIERLLKELVACRTVVGRAAAPVQTMEDFRCPPPPEMGTVRIVENGVKFLVDPAGGFKTGFFCDQRDNRQAFARLARGRKVLDVCSYTGGFGVHAAKAGAAEVTCVDLDAEAAALAKKNGNLNGVRVDAVQADAFPYLRQMMENKRQFGAVVVDPSKLVSSREEFAEGRQKYYDLNRLAMAVVEPGGLLATCSCSGLVGWDDFLKIVRGAAAHAGRRLQVLGKSGAGADHPVAIDYPEGEYLKVLWARVLPAA